MDNSQENERTKEAFKVLERYCQKRYQKAHSFVLTTNSEKLLSPNSAKSLLTPVAASHFSFNSELRRQGSFVSDRSKLEESSPDADPLNAVAEKSPDKQHLLKQESIVAQLWRTIKFLYNKGLKHVLIVLVVIGYTLLGALMFYYLEADGDRLSRKLISKRIEQRQQLALRLIEQLLVSENCTIRIKNMPVEVHVSRVCQQQLADIVQQLSTYVQMNANENHKNQWNWDYWNAVFFALSIVTTIGYGNLSCRTVKGRVATIIYGLFGIPLMLFLLNSIGYVMFSSVQVMWKQAQKKLKHKTRRVCKHILSGMKFNGKLCTSEPSTEPHCYHCRQNTDATFTEEADEEEDGDVFETFPVYLAVIIVFAYVFLCSSVMCFWESWDYFTAFYFFFISISTIGLGDELPEHPRYSICFFVFFIIGLSLGSMCLTIMRMRMENKYMQALQLIDEHHHLIAQDSLSYHNSAPQLIVETSERRLSPEYALDSVFRTNTRWKHPSALAINNDEIIAGLGVRSQLKSVSECLSPAEYYASPILSTLINRHKSPQQSLLRLFSCSACNTTLNISASMENPQIPTRQPDTHLLDTSLKAKKTKARHLRHDEQESLGADSMNSVHSPLTIVVESKMRKSVPS